MLIELLCPRRNNAPVTLPDGSKVQFNEDERGRLVADVASDQALLILRHKGIFGRADGLQKQDPFVESPAEGTTHVVDSTVRLRGSRKMKGQ